MIERNDEIEINLQRLFRAVWDRIRLVAVAAVVCGAAALLAAYCLIPPMYQASAMFYVNNNGGAGEITNSDVLASRELVESYLIVLHTDTTLAEVIDYAGIDRTVDEVREMLAAEAVNETEIFRVTVTAADPAEAESIANGVAHILPMRIDSIFQGASAKIVDAAVPAAAPDSPNYILWALMGAVIGLAAMAGYIVLGALGDTTLREEEDVAQAAACPVLVSVPQMDGGETGKDMGFAPSEAYKLLRTKLQFSLEGAVGSPVIGVTAVHSGEGATLTAVNLAYTLSRLQHKVVLVDCNMRRPSLGETLNIRPYPGLSECLLGQEPAGNVMQPCNLPAEETAFAVISSGQPYAHPDELLSGAHMGTLLEQLRSAYDYVILDLPPVAEVSDGIIAAEAADGVLLVVRRNCCTREALGDAMDRLAFIHGKLLGIVFNCAETKSHGGKPLR